MLCMVKYQNLNLAISSFNPRGIHIFKAKSRRLFCLGSLVILDVARCYLWLFTLNINIKIGKIGKNTR